MILIEMEIHILYLINYLNLFINLIIYLQLKNNEKDKDMEKRDEILEIGRKKEINLKIREVKK